MENIDNLYRAGLAHYADALFAARHFEHLIDESIQAVFNEEKRNLLATNLAAEIPNGYVFLWQNDVQAITREELVIWVTRKHNRCRLNRKGLEITIHVGYCYLREASHAIFAITGINRPFRLQIQDALDDYQIAYEIHGGEIQIYKELLRETGTQQDFIVALQGILDEFIQFLEYKNQQTPNWIATLV